jgi:succinoglycan biosynthesis transport protein ExoP
MQSRTPASPDDIQLSTVFEALKRRARWLILVSAGLGVATFAILSMMAPRYQSEAELAIVAKGASSSFADSRNVSSGPDLVTTRMDKEAINTHVRAMQSPELLGQIATDLKLKDRPEFNSALGPVDMLDRILRLAGIDSPRAGESERDRVLSAFRSRLEVYSAKESRFIGVRMTSIDPDLAAKVANALAESYRTSLAEQGVVEVDDQQSVLQGKVDKLAPEVAAAETEADQYRGHIDAFTGGAQNTGLNDQQMSELTGELTRAKAARGEAEARAKSARDMMTLGSADALPDVQKSPLIQNLVQQRVRVERQISELSATLMPGHPRMRQLNADLAGLKLQIKGEASTIVDSLEKEAKAAQGREDSIEQSLADIKTRVVTNAPEEAKLRHLEANAKAKRTELESLQGQLEANRKRLDTRAQPVEAQIISKAQPTSVPVFPKKFQLSALFAVAALMFGTAWTVTRALFEGARSGATAVRPRPNPAGLRAEPVLTAHPQPPVREASQNALPPMVPQASSVTETEIANLARRLKDKRPAEGGYRTLLTGETESIDASDEALALVRAIAASGPHVILVDWSPSGDGSAGPAAGLDTDTGLNDLLSGDATFEEIIQRVRGSGAHAIASGRALDLAGDDVDPDQLNLVLDALDEVYDHIVVVGRHDEARKLFATIEGRFDAGIVVDESRRRVQSPGESPATFLGFEVADIDIIRFERKASIVQPVNQRIARATQQRPVSMARPA